MNARLSLLLAAVLCHSPALAAEPAPTPAPEAWVQRKLERIIIPRIEFRDASLLEAVEFLRKEARRRDPRGTGIPIKVQMEPSAPAEPVAPAEPRPQISGLEPPAEIPGLVPPSETKITVSLSNIPLGEALKYVTALADMKIWVHPDGVHIVPRSEPAPMFTREFTVPRDFFAAMKEDDRIDHTDSANSAVRARGKFQEYLVANGVSFPTGTKATLSPNGRRLTVYNTKDQFGSIEGILNRYEPVTREFAFSRELFEAMEKQYRITQRDDRIEPTASGVREYLVSEGVRFPMRASVTLSRNSKCLSVRNTADQIEGIRLILDTLGSEVAVAASRKKIERIILHDVVIEDVSLKVAIRYLQDLGVRYDVREPRRNKRGVNIYVGDDPLEDAAINHGNPPPPISYSAKKVSLLDAVRVIANLRGRRIEFEPYGVALMPKTGPGRFVTRNWLCPPDSFGHLVSEPDEAKNWLLSSGVTIEAQASAIYIASTRRLIVRDTEEKLQEMQKQVETMWREYYAKHPPKKKSLR